MSEAIAKCRAIVESRLAALEDEKKMLERMLGWMEVAPEKNSVERVSEGTLHSVAGYRRRRTSQYSATDRKLMRLLWAANSQRRKKGLAELDLEEFRKRRLDGVAVTSDGKPAPKKARRP